MNSDSSKKINNPNSYNWKGVMEFIKEEVKTSTSEWAIEKQILAKKIIDLEKEVKSLKRTNHELLQKINPKEVTINTTAGTGNYNPGHASHMSINNITLSSPLNLDRKIIAEKLFHKRGDSDKLSQEEIDEKLSKFKGKIAKSKQNSDDITKSEVLKNICKRKTKSLGCFDKFLENSLKNKDQNFNGGNINSNNNNGNGGNTEVISSSNKTRKNFNINNQNHNTNFNSNITNRAATLLNNKDITEDTFLNQEGFHSSRINQVTKTNLLNSFGMNYNSNSTTNRDNNNTNKSNTKVIEFAKALIDSSKLSEKEEESHITTQETILQKPKDFLDSFSHKDSSRETVNVSNNIECSFNNSSILNSSENFSRNSMIISQSKFNFNDQYNNYNDLRKSVQSTQSHQSQTHKINYNPFLILKSHFDSVREIYLTPDKKTLISVGEDMLINFWDFKKALKHNKETLEPYHTFRTHTTPIFSLTGPKNVSNSVNPNIYTSGMDGVIRSCKVPEITHFDKNQGLEETIADLSPQPWRAHQDMIWDLNYHPSEGFMSSVSSDGTVKIFKGCEENSSYYSFDTRSKNLIRQFTFKNHYYNFIEIPTSSYWSNKNFNYIFVSHIAPYVKLYDIESGKSICDFNYNVEKNIPFECQQANKIVFSLNLNLVVTGHEDRQLRFFDPNQNKLIKSMIAHTDSVSALSLGIKEYEFLSGSHDGSIRCWDMRISKLLFDVPAHRKKYDEGCLSIKTFPEDKLIISCGADGLIKAFQFN